MLIIIILFQVPKRTMPDQGVFTIGEVFNGTVVPIKSPVHYAVLYPMYFNYTIKAINEEYSMVLCKRPSECL